MVGVWEDGDAADSWKPVAVGAGGGHCIRQLVLGDEDVGGEGRNGVWGVEGTRRGNWICVGLLGQLVKKAVSATEEAAIFEHFGAGWVELPEIALP